MEFTTTGMLNEGAFETSVTMGAWLINIDGIHIDMDRLKKGEVKYDQSDLLY
jgi:hypothetical protein